MLIWEDEKQILISCVEGKGKKFKDKEWLLIVFNRDTFLLEAGGFFYSLLFKSPLLKHSYGKENVVPMEISSFPADF